MAAPNGAGKGKWCLVRGGKALELCLLVLLLRAMRVRVVYWWEWESETFLFSVSFVKCFLLDLVLGIGWKDVFFYWKCFFVLKHVFLTMSLMKNIKDWKLGLKSACKFHCKFHWKFLSFQCKLAMQVSKFQCKLSVWYIAFSLSNKDWKNWDCKFTLELSIVAVKVCTESFNAFSETCSETCVQTFNQTFSLWYVWSYFVSFWSNICFFNKHIYFFDILCGICS